MAQLAFVQPPRTVVGRTVALAGAALLAAGLLALAPQATSGFNASSAESTLWQLLNADRTNNGVAALTRNATLVSIARWRSKDMVERDYFSHTILGTSYNASHWYDLNHLRYQTWGENIAWNSGYTDAESPIKANTWLMASTSHRHNILNPAFTQGGVGAYGADNVNWFGSPANPRVYTELFMRPAGASSPKPVAKPDSGPSLQTAASVAPSPAVALDGWQMLVDSSQGLAPAIVRALGDPDEASRLPSMHAAPAASFRVARVGVLRRGILELLLAGRLEFLLG